ncbi:hypothetical protein CRG98_022023 [Punica granatum]|uniref:CCHC-type domain-containing protein n=1 Tax=Punica granatum TaxID=22663 RepID=A0A2I0JMP3_PUNGR|nr:hypothetical protein CRG98_022023 [Punica granatum]
MTMEDLVIKLRIEEDNKNSEKDLILPTVKVNVMEQGQNSKNKKGKKKLGTNGGVFKPKFQGKCFDCDKKGHRSADCRLPKRKKDHEANVVNEMARDVADINLSVVVSEENLIGSNPKEWWLDTGATRHVCSNRDLFSMLEPVTGERIYMGNSAHSTVEGQCKVVLKMTSGKELTLNNVVGPQKGLSSDDFKVKECQGSTHWRNEREDRKVPEILWSLYADGEGWMGRRKG